MSKRPASRQGARVLSRPVPRPRVFVGYSSEAKTVANAFAKKLSKVAEMVPWNKSPEFGPMDSILDGLLKAVDRAFSSYDFGLFILTPDDILIHRGVETNAARDNVLFELGLFLGAFGRDRTVAVIQSRQGMHIPSDFGGIIIPPFDADDPKQLTRTLAEAAGKVQKVIEDQGRIPLQERVTGLPLLRWDFQWESKQFVMDLPFEFLRRNKFIFAGKKLLLVALQHDDCQNDETNKAIALSVARPLPALAHDVKLMAPGGGKDTNIFRDIKEETEVVGRLLLIPDSLRIRRGMVIKDILDAGGEVAFGGGVPARPASK